jgi:hypothetical protein
MKFKAENNEWHHGFQVMFNNKCTISVQFSKGTYCDQGETTAEVAAWDGDGKWMMFQDDKWTTLEEDTDVMPRTTPDEVAKMMFTLSQL